MLCILQIYGDKDADGFYWGEGGGRRGYVPCNMVSEVHADDERAAQELLNVSDNLGFSAYCSIIVNLETWPIWLV